MIGRSASLLVALSLVLLGFGHQLVALAGHDGPHAAHAAPHEYCHTDDEAPDHHPSPHCPACTLVKAMALAPPVALVLRPALPAAGVPVQAVPLLAAHPSRAPPARGPPPLA